MAGIPWPDDILISRMQFKVVLPQQVVRRNPSFPPVSPRPPRWKIVTVLEPSEDRLMSRFLNSLGGANQIVELPVEVDDAKVEDGEWVAGNIALGGRYLDAEIVGRPNVDDPPDGAMIRLGNTDATDLYEVDGRTGQILHLNPRVLPPTGANRLFRADTVTVRLLDGESVDWGIRDVRLPGQYPGTTVEWIQVDE